MGRPSTPGSSSPGFPSRLFAIVLAGGAGSRLHDLTMRQAKPALPVVSHGRLIDFTLANVANSGIEGAMVLTQFAPTELHRHIDEVWRQSEAAHGLRLDVVDGKDRGGFAGTADAVRKVADEIKRHRPDHVVVLAGDHLYQMDYRPFVARHVRSRAGVTVGAVHVPVTEASEFGVMTLNRGSRIVGFAEKPARPAEAPGAPGLALASMGIYLFGWPRLRALLEEMAADCAALDFGRHVLPRLVSEGKAHAYALPGRNGAAPLWRDLGTVDAYHGVHGELASGRIRLDPAWPLPPHVAGAGFCERWPGCSISDQAVIGEGAVLRDVVVLPGARIGRHAVLDNAIVTADAVIPDGFHLERALTLASGWCIESPGGIRLLSARAMEMFARVRRGRPASFNDNRPMFPWDPQALPKLLAAPNR